MTSLSNTVTPKKRGRPLGSKNKKKPVGYVALKSLDKKANDARVVLLLKSVNELKKRIVELEEIRERLHAIIDNQEHKAIQYRAVIDYLETKLED
jgi:uncharacterized small protein (DUF1192 family)